MGSIYEEKKNSGQKSRATVPLKGVGVGGGERYGFRSNTPVFFNILLLFSVFSPMYFFLLAFRSFSATLLLSFSWHFELQFLIFSYYLWFEKLRFSNFFLSSCWKKLIWPVFYFLTFGAISSFVSNHIRLCPELIYIYINKYIYIYIYI